MYTTFQFYTILYVYIFINSIQRAIGAIASELVWVLGLSVVYELRSTYLPCLRRIGGAVPDRSLPRLGFIVLEGIEGLEGLEGLEGVEGLRVRDT